MLGIDLSKFFRMSRLCDPRIMDDIVPEWKIITSGGDTTQGLCQLVDIEVVYLDETYPLFKELLFGAVFTDCCPHFVACFEGLVYKM